MDEIITPEQWYELKGRIRNLHPELTDNDLQYHEALEQDMLAMVEFIILMVKDVEKEIIEKRNRLLPLRFHLRYRRQNRFVHEVK